MQRRRGNFVQRGGELCLMLACQRGNQCFDEYLYTLVCGILITMLVDIQFAYEHSYLVLFGPWLDFSS